MNAISNDHYLFVNYLIIYSPIKSSETSDLPVNRWKNISKVSSIRKGSRKTYEPIENIIVV